MGKKRKHSGKKGNGNQGKRRTKQSGYNWDNLPWQKLEVPDAGNEDFDDLYNSGKASDQDEGILFSIEEISGDSYVLEKDEMGGVQIKAKPAEEKQNLQQLGKKKKKKKKRNKKGKLEDGTLQPDDAAEKQGISEAQPLSKNKAANEEPENAPTSITGKEGVQSKVKKNEQVGPPSGTQNQESDQVKNGSEATDEENSQKTTKKKKKKKKKKNKEAKPSADAPMKTSEDKVSNTPEQLSEKEAEEMKEWSFLNLHQQLLCTLHKQNFAVPTPIQKMALPAAILKGKDVIGAAETGSGKTLAFGLPLIHTLLQLKGQEEETTHRKLRALVLTPTRELAIQVVTHLKAVIPVSKNHPSLHVISVVGGLAEQKQERLLKRHPEIVVATPGRLWELIHGGNPYLSDLACLNFLIIDEADRMVQDGHFPEMEKLFERIKGQEKRKKELQEMRKSQTAASNKIKSKMNENIDSGENDEYDDFGLPPQEFEVEMFDPSVLEKLEEIRSTTEPVPLEDITFEEEKESETTSGQQEKTANSDAERLSETESQESGQGLAVNQNEQIKGFDDLVDEEKVILAKEGIEIIEVPVEESLHKRQTFVFSATLMLDEKGREHNKGKTWKKAKKKQVNALQRIMKFVGLRGAPAVIDVTNSLSCAEINQSQSSSKRPTLPEGLTLTEIKCLQNDKDTHVYYFLLQYPGRTIVFVNAISQARRLTAILQTLNLPAKALHAQMQQRQRLKSMDFIKSDEKAILVCTDVAARGLDIPNVEHVIHYDLARSAEIFIHRSGRTARAQKTGLSLSIVSPHDEKYHGQTLKVLSMENFQSFPLDPVLLPKTRERVNLAVKVVKMEEKKTKISSTNSWFRQQAEAMDIELDEDLLLEEEASSAKDRQIVREADKAKNDLRLLLSEPLFKDKRKFVNVAEKVTKLKKIQKRSAKEDLGENTKVLLTTSI